MSTTTVTDTERDRASRLVTALAAALHERELSRLSRWRHGSIDRHMIAVTSAAACPEQVDAFQSTATAYAIWHSGRMSPHAGAPDTSLGHALRAVGGAKDPSALRVLDRLLRAQTGEDLHTAVVTAARLLRASSWPPRWSLLAEDLTAWHRGGTGRDEVRARWARDFHTYRERTTPTEPAEQTDSH